MTRSRSRRRTLQVELLESRALQANLMVYVQSWDQRSIVGDTVGYVVSVLSYGKDVVTEDVTLEAELPAGISFLWARDDDGDDLAPVSQSDGHLVFDLGTFETAYNEVISIAAVITEPGTLVTRMEVSTSSPEANAGDNSAEITFVAAPQGLPETTVVSLEPRAKQLRLTFGAALDPDSARHSIRYGLIQRFRSRGVVASRQIRIISIAYDPETWTVTLGTRRSLPRNYMLTVTGLVDANLKEVAPFVHHQGT